MQSFLYLGKLQVNVGHYPAHVSFVLIGFAKQSALCVFKIEKAVILSYSSKRKLELATQYISFRTVRTSRNLEILHV